MNNTLKLKSEASECTEIVLPHLSHRRLRLHQAKNIIMKIKREKTPSKELDLNVNKLYWANKETNNLWGDDNQKVYMPKLVLRHFLDNLNIYTVQDNYTLVGNMYQQTFKSIPSAYYIYYNDDEKLCITNHYTYSGEETEEYKKTKKNIDTMKMIYNYQANSDGYNIYVPLCHATGYLVGLKEDARYMALLYDNEWDKSMLIWTHDDPNKVLEEFKKYAVLHTKDQTLSFGMVRLINGRLSTSYYDYKPPMVDISKNYNDDLPYERINELINTNTSELLLFYGEPGTGKSTLIKSLIRDNIDKDFVFFDSNLMSSLQYDGLVSYFIDNPESVFIFEDCESLLKSRDNSVNPLMSILLNLTDGIIGDVLKNKIICTFNTNVNMIDKALLRKGRLSLKYEFKKLAKEKVNEIAKEIGLENINKDLTLADLYNYNTENDYSQKKTSSLGF